MSVACSTEELPKRIAYSFGIVDLFHYGHLKGIKIAHDEADFHVFGLVTDEAAHTWIGNVVSSEDERRAVLESNRYIDRVVLQKSFDPTENLKLLHEEYPTAEIILFHGDDFSVYPAEEYLKRINGRIQLFDYSESFSPRNIVHVLNRESEQNSNYTNILSTKANTLLALSSRVTLSRIEQLSILTVREYQTDFDNCYRMIQEKHSARIVVRSSSKREDSFNSSNAGHFESVLNVDACDKESVRDAVRAVVTSYEKDGPLDPDDQILIQDMTDNVAVSGVIFSRDIQNNRPYYVINYDDSGSTDSVTSGLAGRTLWIAYDAKKEEAPHKWKGLLSAVEELQSIFKNVLLDIEFAIKRSGEVIIFQVRPLAASYRLGKADNDQDLICLKNEMQSEYSEVLKRQDPYFSDMAFWNPAEIIGSNPHPLDYSLYKSIITHKAWNVGLRSIGYRTVDHDLMYRFGNKPYISVDYAFESLIPKGVGEELSNKLLAYYRDCLRNNPSLHDKIEFDIVFSCYDYSIKERLSSLNYHGFSEREIDEIAHELFYITDRLICNYSRILAKDISDLKVLEAYREYIETIVTGNEVELTSLVCRIKELLHAVMKNGTEQFSRQARCAFVAKSICRSLVDRGAISEEDYDEILKSVSTVAESFTNDIKRYCRGAISLDDLVLEYGHLRAGTYDIRTPRYDQSNYFLTYLQEKQNGDDMLQTRVNTGVMDDLRGGGLSILSRKEVRDLLISNNVGYSVEQLTYFIKNAIEQREYFKFIFTRSLSRCIEMIAQLGRQLGIERNDLSYVDISDIISLENYDGKKEMSNYLQTIIAERKRNYKRNLGLVLPECIFSGWNFDWIEFYDARPNFVTNKVITAPVVELDKTNNHDVPDLEGKIVVIEKADPGYDWIFTWRIAGLLTQYGGAASHMAIRCAEFAIPAAIGCGKTLYKKVSGKPSVTIDCKNGCVRF